MNYESSLAEYFALRGRNSRKRGILVAATGGMSVEMQYLDAQT